MPSADAPDGTGTPGSSGTSDRSSTPDRSGTSGGTGEEVLRLAAVIDRQRQELDQARLAAAARSVADMATGVLIERLGCSPAEAASQLTALAREASTPVTEIAAAIINQDQALPITGPITGPSPGRPGAPAAADTAQTASAVLRNQLAGAAAALAADGGEFAAAVLDQALAPLGAAAVALWLIGVDGSLGLLGEAGLGPAEASRWRWIPPQMDCLEQRVAGGGPDLWWPGPGAGERPEPALPLAGHWPDGARTVIALHDHASALLGVMEICWPRPQADFPAALRQQVGDLTRACAQLLSARVARGELTLVRSRPALRGLLGGLLETVLLASAVRDDTGTVTDFRIDYAASPAGRTPGASPRTASPRAASTRAGAMPPTRPGARWPRPTRPWRARCWTGPCRRWPPASPSTCPARSAAARPGPWPARSPTSGSPGSSTGW